MEVDSYMEFFRVVQSMELCNHWKDESRNA